METFGDQVFITFVGQEGPLSDKLKSFAKICMWQINRHGESLSNISLTVTGLERHSKSVRQSAITFHMMFLGLSVISTIFLANCRHCLKHPLTLRPM